MSHADDGTLHAYIDGELTALEAARLEAHLAECAPCRGRLAQERDVVARASGILASAEPPARALRPLHQLRPSIARRLRIPVAWAASIVIALGAGWLAFGNDRAARTPETAAVEADAFLRVADSLASPPPARTDQPPPRRIVAERKPLTADVRPTALTRDTARPATPPQARAAERPAQLDTIAVRREAGVAPAAEAAGVVGVRTDEIDLDSARALLDGELHAISGVAIGAVRWAGDAAVVVEQEVAKGVVVRLREEVERPGRANVTTRPGPERIVGRVTDATSGAPVANAVVAVTGAPRTTYTGEGGAFVIDSVAPGTYSVQARMLGYESAVAPAARVDSGRTTSVDFSLRRSQVMLDAVVVTAAEQAARTLRAARPDSHVAGRAKAPAPTRRVGRLRVQISGPLPPDSLTKLLEKVAPIP